MSMGQYIYANSGYQKNDPLLERFFLQPLMPAFRSAEPIFENQCKAARLSV